MAVEDLPEWSALEAAHDAATSITTPKAGHVVEPGAANRARSDLIHAAHALVRASRRSG